MTANGGNAQPEGRRWLRNGAVLFSIVFAVLLIASLTYDVVRRLDALATANSDNMQWTLSQLEVEALRLELAVAAAAAASGDQRPAALAELRTRFDVFYSRFQTVRSSRLSRLLRTNAAHWEQFDRLDAYLSRQLPLIDGPNGELLAALPELAGETRNAAAEARNLALFGLASFAAQSDIERRGVASTLLRVALATGLLIIALSVLSIALLRLYRIGQARAAAVERVSERYRTVISTSLDAVVVTDDRGRVLDFNSAAEQVFGYRRDEVIGRPISETIISDRHVAACGAGMRRYRDTGARRVIGHGRVELEARRSSGEVFPVELSLAAAHSGQDEIFVAFIRDITQRKIAQDELMRARDDALAGEKAKSEFLAVMSHEMRTPLNGLLGSIEMLRDTASEPQQRELIDLMDTSGRLLLRHVNDVLDISKYEAGKIALDPRPLDLRALIEEVVSSQDGSARARNNHLGIGDIPDFGGPLMGDPLRLRQVLLNLIGNAVKFTRDGEITVDADVLGRRGGRVQVEIRVSDTGIGIAPEDQARVFEDFVTLDPSFQRDSGGTGLGLGICRRLVQAMGGEIGAESEPGEGSLFWVRIPFAPAQPVEAEAEPPGPPPTLAMGPRDVLVVEDDEINRIVARQMLAAAGHRVTLARDGGEGVRLAAVQRYDVIFLDISMPGMDGIEAAARIRAADGASRAAPIVALTAHALPQDIERFRAAGMADCLTKPVTRAQLERAIETATAGGAGLGNAARAARSDLLDRAMLSDLRSDVGSERFDTLVARFVAEADMALHHIAEAAESGTMPAGLIGTIHKLAGSAAVFGCHRLSGALVQAECALKRGEQSVPRETAAALDDLWRRTRLALERPLACGDPAPPAGAELKAAPSA